MMKRPAQLLTFVLLLSVSLNPLIKPASDRNAIYAQGANASSSVVLDRTTAEGAIDDFQTALNQRWSYRHANGSDFDAAIAALRKRNLAGMSVNELGIELQKILALGVDGHSGVFGYRLPPGGCLPFLIEAVGSRFVAFTPDRRAFLADGFPFITRIDGKDIGEWSEAAAVLVSKGSPQYIRHRSLNLLREIDYWRSQLNLPRKETVEVQLSDRQGSGRKVLTLSTVKAPLAYGVWPSGGSRMLASNVGYLRLASMREGPSLAEIKLWMPRFRTTSGLIVDVRDNNGGDRAALLALYSYLAAPEDPPHVFTAAAYRLHRLHPENYLAENHHMFRANASEWSPAERRAVVTFARIFKPRWKLAPGEFSEWHFMTLNRLDDPESYHYDKPMIVLMNAKCFSATDIFLAGLKGLKNVRLVGMPSSGGSAYSQEVTLGTTPLRVRIGTMASFQADGKLFDGNGIQPDIRVEVIPEYFVGGPDKVLDQAVRLIERSTSSPRRRAHRPISKDDGPFTSGSKGDTAHASLAGGVIQSFNRNS
ncbi:MAG TPA: S41 family peptidase [Pyrinomonadaceae bacterium]|jgi:hypothetical protein|nr:S41 family peptidase [Pyrinomonadaceae bacterium]